MPSPAESYARSRQPTLLPTVRFSPATTVEFTPAANSLCPRRDSAGSARGATGRPRPGARGSGILDARLGIVIGRLDTGVSSMEIDDGRSEDQWVS
jgi:hypothetical protein